MIRSRGITILSLPPIESELRAINSGTYMCDYDVGEIVLNFMLHPAIRSHIGVNLTQFDPEEVENNSRLVHARWERIMMGYLPSPYFVTKDMIIVENIIKGCRLDLKNVYCWKEVILDLPRMESYDPTLP